MKELSMEEISEVSGAGLLGAVWGAAHGGFDGAWQGAQLGVKIGTDASTQAGIGAVFGPLAAVAGGTLGYIGFGLSGAIRGAVEGLASPGL